MCPKYYVRVTSSSLAADFIFAALFWVIPATCFMPNCNSISWTLFAMFSLVWLSGMWCVARKPLLMFYCLSMKWLVTVVIPHWDAWRVGGILFLPFLVLNVQVLSHVLFDGGWMFGSNSWIKALAIKQIRLNISLIHWKPVGRIYNVLIDP